MVVARVVWLCVAIVRDSTTDARCFPIYEISIHLGVGTVTASELHGATIGLLVSLMVITGSPITNPNWMSTLEGMRRHVSECRWLW